MDEDFKNIPQMKDQEQLHPEGYVESTALTSLGITNATSTRQLGNMSLSRDRDGTVDSNFTSFMGHLEIDQSQNAVAVLGATHSTNVALLRRTDGSQGRLTINGKSPEVQFFQRFQGIGVPKYYLRHRDSGIDAAVTQDKGLFIGILPADCAVVTFFDPTTQTLGVAHAGAIGAFSGIMLHTVDCMNQWFGVDVQNIHCYMSPCVTRSKYKLGASGMWQHVFKGNVDDQYADTFDLREFIREQLLKKGVPTMHLHISSYCTLGEEDLFFSSARGKTKAEKEKEGRNLSLSGMLKKK